MAIAVIKRCWTGEPFTFEGAQYQVTEVTCTLPVQKPHPPVLIAGAGRRMLGIAGREADVVGISPLGNRASGFEHFGPSMAVSGERIEDQLSWIREGAGARFADIEISVMAHHPEVTDDVVSTAERLASEWGATPDQVLTSPQVFLGSTGQIRDRFLSQRERFGISYVVFASAHLYAVQPVVAELAGT